MFLVFLLGSALAAEQNKDRPVMKKIAHLKEAAPAMVKMYFTDAEPSPNIPEHANGPLNVLKRRERVAGRLSGKLITLANVVEKAVKDGCVTTSATGRTSLERFKENNFKIAARQILKNYLRLRENLSEDTKKCRQHVNKITRKVKRYDGNLRNKYCAKIYKEEWCGNEYEYSLDDRVTNKNPYEALKQ
jgi:hypothetical protein